MHTSGSLITFVIRILENCCAVLPQRWLGGGFCGKWTQFHHPLWGFYKALKPSKGPSCSAKVCKRQPAASVGTFHLLPVEEALQRGGGLHLPGCNTALVHRSACRQRGREKPISKHPSIWRAAVGLCATPCALQDRWERR